MLETPEGLEPMASVDSPGIRAFPEYRVKQVPLDL